MITNLRVEIRYNLQRGVASSVITQVQRPAAPAAQPRAGVRGCDRVGGGRAAAGRGRAGEAVRGARPGHGQARAQPALGGQPRSAARSYNTLCAGPARTRKLPQ